MTLPKDNRHLGLSLREFDQNWFCAYNNISRYRGRKDWQNAARLYDYLLYRARRATRFKLTELSNKLVMNHAGLGPNTMKPARDFLVNQGLLAATPEDSKGEHWTLEILNPATFTPFADEWRTDDPATVDTGWGSFTMADLFDPVEFEAE